MWDRPEQDPEHDESGLEDVIGELRAEVPVRPEWRARLQRELLAASPDGMEPDMSTVGAISAGVIDAGGRAARATTAHTPIRWQLRPVTAIAAAMAFTVLGAAGALLASGRARAGEVASSDSAAVPAIAASNTTGQDVGVRFAVLAPGVKHVSLVGDFNGWNPKSTPLMLARDGRTWSILVPLASGRHTYAFVIDDEIVADPAAPAAVDDDFGTPSSLVLVGNTLP